MKKLIWIITCSLLYIVSTNCSFAQAYQLSVHNDSIKTLTIVKADGTRFMVRPHGFVNAESFEVGSDVQNYSNDKLLCTWHIWPSTKCLKTVGLIYGSETHGHPNCHVVLQSSPC